jgi:hypothetical protein
MHIITPDFILYNMNNDNDPKTIGDRLANKPAFEAASLAIFAFGSCGGSCRGRCGLATHFGIVEPAGGKPE